MTGRVRQSFEDMLLTPVNYFAFDLDHLPTLARLMNRGVIQILINNPLWITGPPWFSRWCQGYQFVK